MPEPFKNYLNKNVIVLFATSFSEVCPSFDSASFEKSVMDDKWENRELMERIHHITAILKAHLPDDYLEALKILKKVYSNFSGMGTTVFPDFVQTYGLDYFDESVEALDFFTRNSTSEFAVRPFIKKYGSRMMKVMNRWAESDNEDVRRLSSEGCRPRLPWAIALPQFKKDPKPIFPILEKLINDESEYVRKSVANNLNDISKDNPEFVISFAKKWLGKNKESDWIIKHACRTLLKNGDHETLKLFGYIDPKHIKMKNFSVDKSVKMGDDLSFSFSLTSIGCNLGKIRVEYMMHFLRKNGKLNQKVFKISEFTCNKSEITYQKKYSFKQITTRKYYPGTQEIEIVVNGKSFSKKSFELIR